MPFDRIKLAFHQRLFIEIETIHLGGIVQRRIVEIQSTAGTGNFLRIGDQIRVELRFYLRPMGFENLV